VPQKRKQPVFVVPFFLDGNIDQMHVYSDVTKAQGALRRYVGYSALLRQVKDKTPGISRTRALLDAYGAIDRTPYAGTCVYEIVPDDNAPVRKRGRRLL
jgi:hypothetical protein